MRIAILFLLLSIAPLHAAEPQISLYAKGDLNQPFGGDMDAAGNHIVVEFGGHSLKSVSPTGVVTLLAGGKKGNADGVGAGVQFNSPHNCVIHPKTGDVYIADSFNHTIRKYDVKTKQVTTVAGTGKPGFAGDNGPAASAQFNETYHIAFDTTGEVLFIADLKNTRIRQWNLKTNLVTTIAGNGKKGVPTDEANAIDSPLVDPRAVIVDSKNRLYILERGGHALRVVEAGKIRTVAGTGKAGNTGDEGPALPATFNGPKFLCVDKEDRVVMADTENHTIRRYDPKTGTITRLAGTGKRGTGDPTGDPLKCGLARPHGVTFNAAGELLISDTENNRILKVK
jgi:DNA-binding beta-propeller fold protein YncE